jgi:4-alpha-glucanotransferase
MLVTAALDDALGVLEPANRPGTRYEWPNWSLALPASLEAIQRSPLMRSIADVLRAKRPEARAAFDKK